MEEELEVTRCNSSSISFRLWRRPVGRLLLALIRGRAERCRRGERRIIRYENHPKVNTEQSGDYSGLLQELVNKSDSEKVLARRLGVGAEELERMVTARGREV